MRCLTAGIKESDAKQARSAAAGLICKRRPSEGPGDKHAAHRVGPARKNRVRWDFPTTLAEIAHPLGRKKGFLRRKPIHWDHAHPNGRDLSADGPGCIARDNAARTQRANTTPPRRVTPSLKPGPAYLAAGRITRDISRGQETRARGFLAREPRTHAEQNGRNGT